MSRRARTAVQRSGGAGKSEEPAAVTHSTATREGAARREHARACARGQHAAALQTGAVEQRDSLQSELRAICGEGHTREAAGIQSAEANRGPWCARGILRTADGVALREEEESRQRKEWGCASLHRYVFQGARRGEVGCRAGAGACGNWPGW